MGATDSVGSEAETDNDACFGLLIMMGIKVCQVILVGRFSVDAVCKVGIGAVKVYI